MVVKTFRPKKTALYRPNCARAIERALQTTTDILSERPEELNGDEVHQGKSVLYAAIEQIGIEINRFETLQRMLRELLVIVNTAGDLQNLDRHLGFQILFDLFERCRPGEPKQLGTVPAEYFSPYLKDGAAFEKVTLAG